MVSKVGGGRRIKFIILMFFLSFVLLPFASAEEMTIIDTVTLNSGENNGVGITIYGAYGYISTFTNPARVIKVRLSDMTRIGSLTLGSGENNGVGITNDGTYGYIATYEKNSKVIKIRLSDMARIGTVELNVDYGSSITIDGTYGYVVTYTGPAKVVKIRLSDMALIGSITLEPGENNGYGITNDGTYGYIVTYTSPAKVVKIRLSDMTRIGSLTLEPGENSGYGITNDGTYGYVSTFTSPSKVVKVRLSDMTRIGSITVDQNPLRTITNDGTYVHVVTYTIPTKLVKIKIAENLIKPPTGLIAMPLAHNQVQLSWNANTEPDLAGYIIYRDYVEIAHVGPAETSFIDSEVQPNTYYTYGIKSYDIYDLISDMSNAATITTPDISKPIVSVNVNKNTLNISWAGNADSYLVMINNEEVYNTTGNQYAYSAEPGWYKIQVIAVTGDSEIASDPINVQVSSLTTPGPAKMASDLLHSAGLVLFPIGSLLALGLAIKATPLIITAVKTFLG